MAYFCEKKDNIPTLEDVCVRFVCKNLNFLTFVDGPEHELRRRWRFPYPNFRISPQPAQKILLQLCKRNALDDERMSLFSSDSLNLISPVIKEANVSPASLRVLKEFRLSNLSAMNLPNVNLNSIIGCLGEWTVHNLISLNVTGTSIMCETNLPILVVLGRFKNLQVLNVSRTEFTTSNLQIVADDLSNLQHLNISRTRVTDISPLLAIRDRLTGLIMHRLELEHREDVEKLLWNIVQLHQLRTLDVSDRPQPAVGGFAAVSRLCSATALPHLVHLDLSGNPFGLRLEDARVLVANHPKLVFVGFASWLSNHEHELEGIHKLSMKYPGITMLGDRGDQLLLNTLTRNKDRAIYLQNALHSIFEATSNRESLKPDLLQAVLRVMRLHLRRMEMILAGTAVIYNLTRSEQSGQLPLELLNRAVRMTLTAMEKFPKNRQLQKNCFLTLCSDTVLYRATFNCSQCCELVFNNLIAFDDVHMKRMGVAIISILAAEISTAGLSELAKDRRRIQCLLMYVAEKCLLDSDQNELEPMMPEYFSLLRFRPEGAPIFDTTLRFTLSALWNLTDECPEACLGFVQEGGLQIYEKVLKRFADQEEEIKNHVYTKCLGLLNNVAEVEETRNTLLVDSLMDFFFKMLRHPNIQISYFAAGIIAHLSCLKDEVWHSALQSSKESYITILGQSVCSWKPPQSEMVAYRSFEPFEKVVLHPESRLEVHLWAVWAIHHILTRKVSAVLAMSSNPETQKPRELFDPQKILETHPAFMSEIDPSNDDPAVAALQALKYESENPNANASSYKDEGNYYYKRKEFSKAIDSYTGGLRAKPTDVKLLAILLTNRAICHWYLKNYGSCIRDCKAALAADPDHLKAYVKAVDACLALEKVDECLELCERGLTKFPQCEQMTVAQMKALKLQMKTEKTAAVKSELAQKELNTQLATLDIIRNRGITVNTNLQPINVPEAAGARFYVDPSNRLHWSVLFMYPEFGQTDFLQDVVETFTVLECLRLVFDPNQPPPSWDTHRLYCCSDDSLKVYFEDTVQTQKLVSFSPNLTIDRLTRRKDFSVRRDLLIVIHVISKNSKKFYDRWKNELF